MRNTVLTSVSAAAAISLSMLALACGGDPSSTEDTSPSNDDTSAPAAPAAEAPPTQDLASANAGTTPSVRTGAATAHGSGRTDTPANPGSGSSSGGSSSGGSDGTGSGSSSGGDGTSSGGSSSGGSSSGAPAIDPNAGAGPKPTTTCTVSKDGSGFFTRGSGASSYVAYVPASYDGTAPMRLVVGLHGCGDNAYNYATWGVNPYDTRATQNHIGISMGGADGSCWSTAADAAVLAAINDISSCFWVHQKKVVIGGFSSGGRVAYRLGLAQASRFAGILVEDSGLDGSTPNADAALANASWKLHIAHRTHTSDPTFPLAQVKADWAKITAAGFPLVTSETPGQHDGTSTDWASWLLPQSASWVAP